MPTSIKGKLIHVGRINSPAGGATYLFLRLIPPNHFVWFEGENETAISGHSVEEAVKQARDYWKHHSYRTVNCGFKYTGPERDEHGMNALFYEMVASYKSMNGYFFDEDRGHNCFVQNASKEALDLMSGRELTPPT